MLGGQVFVVLLVMVGSCLGGWPWGSDNENRRHNISVGTIGQQFYPDVLLFTDSQVRESSWIPFRVLSKEVCYPPEGLDLPRFTITKFNVTDLEPEDKGGYASITTGGVGQDNLCLLLESQRGKGYNFIVHVWGYYNNFN